MIAEFLNRDVILRVIDQIKKLPADGSSDRRGGTSTSKEDAKLVLDELTQAADQETKAPSGPKEGPRPPAARRGTEEAVPLEDRAFISGDPIISLLQSSLDALYTETDAKNEVIVADPNDRRRGGGDVDPVSDVSIGFELPPDGPANRRIFDQFSVTDLGWVRSKLAEGIRLFRKRHKFNDKPADPKTMPERTRVVMVGDWGSGVPRARAVGDWMRKEVEAAQKDGIATHVIHLGDVYYSGWGHEYNNRFLPYWPVKTAEAKTIGSWTLNGNHDMYSGGHAYYDTCLAEARFKPWQSNAAGGSSFFSLASKKWKILGLDSSWDDGGFKDPQGTWLRKELEQAEKNKQKVMLLSHHQYVSAYEGGAKDMIAKVTPILTDHPVKAWIWGHEHRCMWYSKNSEVEYNRCLGDGGVPVYQWHDGKAVKAPGTYEHTDMIRFGLEQWARMGFAVLDFMPTGEIEVRYIDETGNKDKGGYYAKETIA